MVRIVVLAHTRYPVPTGIIYFNSSLSIPPKCSELEITVTTFSTEDRKLMFLAYTWTWGDSLVSVLPSL